MVTEHAEPIASSGEKQLRLYPPNSTRNSNELTMPVVRLAQFKRTPPQSENLHRKHDILREKEGLSAYHPQHWGETRVVQFHSDHPLWGVLYGIAANPYLLF